MRVVVDFTGGTFALNEANADDPSPADGDARVEIRHAGIRVVAADVRGARRARPPQPARRAVARGSC